MYRIGEFSRISDLSIRTLRYYDSIGLLNPGYVDNFTGYRYYTDDNLNEVSLIKLLRNVGFSLEDIIIHKNELTEELMDQRLGELEDEKQCIDRKIYLLNMIKEELKLHEDKANNVVSLKKSINYINKAS